MGLARCSRQQARAVLSARVPGGPLTQFASERIWAPAERLSVTVAGGAASSPLPRAPVRLRSRQSRRRLRRSTRSQSGPRPPASAARTPYPDSPPELARVTAPVDAVAAACAPAGGERVSLQSPPGFPEEQSPRASPTRGWGRRLPGGWGTRPGKHGGEGPAASGACARRSAEVRPPGPARGKALSGARGKGRGGARSRSGQGRAWAPGRSHYLASVVFPEPGRPRRR